MRWLLLMDLCHGLHKRDAWAAFVSYLAVKLRQLLSEFDIGRSIPQSKMITVRKGF